MLNFIPTLYNKLFGPMPALTLSAPPPFCESAMEAAQDRARELTGSGPSFREEDLAAVLKAMEIILKQPVKEDRRGGARPGAGRPRRFGFYDIDVGKECRVPRSASMSARAAAYSHAKATGKMFTTRTKQDGLWIKRVA